MILLKRISVKRKLIVSFLLLAILIGISGTVGVINAGRLNSNSEKMYFKSLKSVEYIEKIKDNLDEERACLLNIIYNEDMPLDEKGKMLRYVTEELKQKNIEYFKKYEAIPFDEEEKKTILNLKMIYQNTEI
nr:MCP four helix bundle domain-containing protein [Clostridium botulinum]